MKRLHFWTALLSCCLLLSPGFASAKKFKEYFKSKKLKKMGNKYKNSLNKRKQSVNRLMTSYTIKPKEHVVFFPTLAYQVNGGLDWRVEIHGWIFKDTKFSNSRTLAKKIVGFKMLDKSERYRDLVNNRLRWFLVDNKGNKVLTIRLNHRTYRLQRSSANGHFYGQFDIPVDEVRHWPLDADRRMSFRAITQDDDPRNFIGHVHFIRPRGISVISDIDDTIKLSDVHDKKKLIRNTFFKRYKSVPGMAQTYRRWATRRNVHFHYLTASPWQLYVPLNSFLNEQAFPTGTFHMKYFRLKDKTVLNLFKKQHKYKSDIIVGLLKRYPQRRFILVGDMGESDLAIYSEVANRHPGRIRVIYVRDTGYAKKANPQQIKKPNCPVVVFKTNRNPAQLRFTPVRNFR